MNTIPIVIDGPNFINRILEFQIDKDLIDDRKHNQLRVNHNGEVYFSHDVTENIDIVGVKFRWETYSAFNGYVGPIPASDPEYIAKNYQEVVLAWENNDTGYYRLLPNQINLSITSG